jgi:hypothetical protein
MDSPYIEICKKRNGANRWFGDVMRRVNQPLVYNPQCLRPVHETFPRDALPSLEVMMQGNQTQE